MTDGLVEAVARALCVFENANWDAANYRQTPSGEAPDEMRAGYMDAAQAALAAIKAQGLVVVPVEPTEGMIEAGADSYGDRFYFKPEHAARCFAAMIAAAGEG
jgi:hypothetical protein